MTIPLDLARRQRALEPGLSCIVQAPAGSGKTGLLIQRYLALLAIVEHPEEIGPAVERGLTADRPTLIHVPIGVLGPADE